MARKRQATDERTRWAITDKGKLLECVRGLPDGAILTCAEGDKEWTPVSPSVVAAKPRPAERGTLLDGPSESDDNSP